MIEITAGVAFLVSSVYGAGHAINTANVAVQDTSKNQSAITETRLLKDTKEVESYLREVYADTPILVDIARCESQFRQYNDNGTVIRGRVDRADIGVMQINERYHGERADALSLDIYTIEGNTAFAQYLYDKYGLQPWSASALCWSKTSKGVAKK